MTLGSTAGPATSEPADYRLECRKNAATVQIGACVSRPRESIRRRTCRTDGCHLWTSGRSRGCGPRYASSTLARWPKAAWRKRLARRILTPEVPGSWPGAATKNEPPRRGRVARQLFDNHVGLNRFRRAEARACRAPRLVDRPRHQVDRKTSWQPSTTGRLDAATRTRRGHGNGNGPEQWWTAGETADSSAEQQRTGGGDGTAGEQSPATRVDARRFLRHGRGVRIPASSTKTCAPVVEWIPRVASDHETRVRFLPGVPVPE